MVVIVMGVSGSGKTTVGRELAARLSLPFFDADDFHPEANIRKMSRGIALTDADRAPWLDRLHGLLAERMGAGGAVLACSALRERYRLRLTEGLGNGARVLFLKADFESIYERMEARRDHFMPPGLLRSQFDTLEEPGAEAVVVDASGPVEAVVREAIAKLGASESAAG